MRRSMRPSGSSFSASAGMVDTARAAAVDGAAKRGVATDDGEGRGVFRIRRMRRQRPTQ